MNYDDTYIGTVFLAPASYLIEELQEQEKEVFKTESFNMTIWFAELSIR